MFAIGSNHFGRFLSPRCGPVCYNRLHGEVSDLPGTGRPAGRARRRWSGGRSQGRVSPGGRCAAGDRRPQTQRRHHRSVHPSWRRADSREYSKEYIAQAVIVIAATNDPAVNEQVYHDCQELEILCNVVDEPRLCDFFVPAVVKRGDLQIAIGTEGNCPAYAGHLRKKLERCSRRSTAGSWPSWNGYAGRLSSRFPAADRKALLGKLVDDESFEYFRTNGPAAWRERAQAMVTSQA